MLTLFSEIKKSFERFVQHPVFGVLRSPDRIDEAPEIRRAGDAGCLGDEPKPSTRSEPRRNPGGYDLSTAINAEKPAVKRKYITNHHGKLRVRIPAGKFGKVHVGCFDTMQKAIRARNRAVADLRAIGATIKCGARD